MKLRPHLCYCLYVVVVINNNPFPENVKLVSSINTTLGLRYLLHYMLIFISLTWTPHQWNDITCSTDFVLIQALYSHALTWLDCSNCLTDLENMMTATTKHFWECKYQCSILEKLKPAKLSGRLNSKRLRLLHVKPWSILGYPGCLQFIAPLVSKSSWGIFMHTLTCTYEFQQKIMLWCSHNGHLMFMMFH